MIEVELPSGQILEVPTNDAQEAKTIAAKYWNKNSSKPTQRSQTELENLPEFGASPELGFLSGDLGRSIKAGASLSLMQGQEEKDVMREYFPDATFEHDDQGRYIINVDSGSYYLNRPGFSGQDVAEFATRAGASMLGGAAGIGRAALVKAGLMQGGIEAGLQTTEKALGGEFNPLDVGVSAAAGTAGEYVGGQVTKGLTNVSNMVKGSDIPLKDTLKLAKEKGIDILASDVVPPNTALGKFFRGVGEKIGPIGTGKMRAKQQAARIEVVEDLAKSFGLGADEFDIVAETNIIKDLGKEVLAMKQKGAVLRNQAVESLSEFGEVPANTITKAIDDSISREMARGEVADQAIIKRLEQFKNSIAGGDFEKLKNIRSAVIDDIESTKGVRPEGLPTRARSYLEKVKKAFDTDMKTFASNNDREAASKWIKSNRIFAEGYGRAKETAIKRLLNKGEETPELVNSILKGQRISDLQRLRSGLSLEGRKNAKTAVMKKILSDAKFFEQGANPNRVVSSFDKNKKLIDTFFTGSDKKEIIGLKKLLDVTSRAQDAAVMTETGVQALYASIGTVFGAGMVGDPVITGAATAGVAGMTRAYESKFRRDLLVKLGESGLSSAAENQLINKIARSAAATTASMDE